VIAETIITPTGEADEVGGFANIKKYNTFVGTNYEQIFETNIKWVECLEVRVVFTEYEGNVLGTKLGIGINDYDHAICERRYPFTSGVSTGATNTSSSGK